MYECTYLFFHRFYQGEQFSWLPVWRPSGRGPFGLEFALVGGNLSKRSGFFLLRVRAPFGEGWKYLGAELLPFVHFGRCLACVGAVDGANVSGWFWDYLLYFILSVVVCIVVLWCCLDETVLVRDYYLHFVPRLVFVPIWSTGTGCANLFEHRSLLFSFKDSQTNG